MKVDTLKLAQTLYRLFEMRFSRDWEDLPEEIRQDWMGSASDLKAEMGWE